MVWYVNWRTKITHLLGDCHQIARIPPGTAWLERQEGTALELTATGRRYCGWCVSRIMVGIDDMGDAYNPGAELHPPAERADYLTVEKAAAAAARDTEARAAAGT